MKVSKKKYCAVYRTENGEEYKLNMFAEHLEQARYQAPDTLPGWGTFQSIQEVENF